jgi:hypothetical protein
MNGKVLRIELGSDEALVLFEFLARCDDAESLPLIHPAERQVLWRVEGQLEKLLVEVFSPEYTELVRQARERVEPDPPEPK